MECDHSLELLIGLWFASLSTVLLVQHHGVGELLALLQLPFVQCLEDFFTGIILHREEGFFPRCVELTQVITFEFERQEV